jgi:hypothetical protein
MLKKIILTTAVLGVAPMCWAYEVVQAHGTAVETTYMPTAATFTVDIGTASCPAGGWLTWNNASTDNNKSAFALLIAAINSGNRIQYFINNGDTTCKVQFFYALAS